MSNHYLDRNCSCDFVSELTLAEATNYVNEFSNGVTDGASLWHNVLSSDRSVYKIVSESYEVMIDQDVMDIPKHKVSEMMADQLENNGLGHKVSWMQEQIDRRFKNPRAERTESLYQIDSTSENDVKTLLPPSTDYTEINGALIEPFEELIQMNQNVIVFLKNNPVGINLEQKFLEFSDLFLKVLQEKSKFFEDGRQKICKLDQLKTLELCQSRTLNSIYDALIAYKMEQSTMTSKQMGKTIEMGIKQIFELLRPMNQIDAIEMGLSGNKCDMCTDGWRMTKKYNSDNHAYEEICLDCGNWQKEKIAQLLKV